MTDIPTHDQFALPSELPDSAAPGGAHPPAPSREREGEARGTPSEDWRARGLAHPAGRGWVGDAESPSRMREGSETCGPEGDVSRSGVGASDPMHTQGYTVLTPERLAAFLSQLAECGNVRLACRAAGISPQTAYRARRKSAALARQWDAAILAARPIAEDSLADKAMHGWLEAQFYRGEPCGEKYRFDGRLLLAHLGRLDKLAERVAAENGWRGSRGEAAAMAGLDAAIETLERGEALDEPDAVGVGVRTGAGAAESQAHDAVPGVPSSLAPVDWGPDWCPRCGDHTMGPAGQCRDAACREYTLRVGRMEAYRPPNAPTVDELEEDNETMDDIESLQLTAYEAGVPGWWDLTTLAEFDAAMAGLGKGEDRDEDRGEDRNEGEDEEEDGPSPCDEAEPERAPEPAPAGNVSPPRALPSVRTI